MRTGSKSAALKFLSIHIYAWVGLSEKLSMFPLSVWPTFNSRPGIEKGRGTELDHVSWTTVLTHVHPSGWCWMRYVKNTNISVHLIQNTPSLLTQTIFHLYSTFLFCFAFVFMLVARHRREESHLNWKVFPHWRDAGQVVPALPDALCFQTCPCWFPAQQEIFGSYQAVVSCSRGEMQGHTLGILQQGQVCDLTCR